MVYPGSEDAQHGCDVTGLVEPHAGDGALGLADALPMVASGNALASVAKYTEKHTLGKGPG